MAQGLATSFLDSFMQGYQMPGQLRALDEAREKYGERANNPGLFSALEGENRQQQAHQSTMATQAQTRDIRGNQEARTSYNHSTQVEDNDGAKKRQAVLGMVNGLRSARDNGEDIGAAFDSQLEIMQNLGVKEEDIPEMRQAVIDNPAILDDYLATLTGGKKADASTTKGSDREKARVIMNDPAATEADKQWAGKVMGIKVDKSGAEKDPAEDVQEVIGSLREYYTELNEGGGIVNPDNGVLPNTVAWLRGSWAGRTSGRMTGSENESSRRSIEAIRPHLLLAVKAAEELGARMFDSNKDMEMWLSTVTDPSQDYRTVQNALDQFEKQYGKAIEEAQAQPTLTPGFVDPETGAVFNGGDPGNQDSWSQP